MFVAYILKSLKDGTFYKGVTKNLTKRLSDHNSGRVRSTKSHRPWVIHYYEEFNNKTDALKREKFFKSYEGYLWLKTHGII